jgi:hypothetical protein
VHVLNGHPILFPLHGLVLASSLALWLSSPGGNVLGEAGWKLVLQRHVASLLSLLE